MTVKEVHRPARGADRAKLITPVPLMGENSN
jgi:hypothetical protein